MNGPELPNEVDLSCPLFRGETIRAVGSPLRVPFESFLFASGEWAAWASSLWLDSWWNRPLSGEPIQPGL